VHLVNADISYKVFAILTNISGNFLT